MALIVIAGCTSAAPVTQHEVSDRHRAWVDEKLAGDLTDFERKVLEDYWVTDEEYAQARDMFRACVEDEGFEVILEDGQTTVFPKAGAAFWSQFDSEEAALTAQDAVVDECSIGTTMFVEAAYSETRENPEGWSWYEAMVACAEALGLTEGRGLSEDEMMEAIADDDFLIECRSDPWRIAQEARS